MKNSDMPAMPNLHGTDCNGDSYQSSEYNGLTKREQFAAMAMQGLVSSPLSLELFRKLTGQDWIKNMNVMSIELGDGLLETLDDKVAS